MARRKGAPRYVYLVTSGGLTFGCYPSARRARIASFLGSRVHRYRLDDPKPKRWKAVRGG